MAEETVAAETVATATPVTEEVKPTAVDWSKIPEDQLDVLIESKTGIKLEKLAGLQKVLEEVKEDRKAARAENHALKEFKDSIEIDGAKDKSELEAIYNRRLEEIEAKQTSVITEAQEAKDVADARMKKYILEATGAKKLTGLVEPSLIDYIVEDIKKDFGVGDDNKLYKLIELDGKQVVGKASFEDEFKEWFGQHRLNEFVLEGGVRGSGSRTGDSLKDSGPSMAESVKELFGATTKIPKSAYDV